MEQFEDTGIEAGQPEAEGMDAAAILEEALGDESAPASDPQINPEKIDTVNKRVREDYSKHAAVIKKYAAQNEKLRARLRDEGLDDSDIEAVKAPEKVEAPDLSAELKSDLYDKYKSVATRFRNSKSVLTDGEAQFLELMLNDNEDGEYKDASVQSITDDLKAVIDYMHGKDKHMAERPDGNHDFARIKKEAAKWNDGSIRAFLGSLRTNSRMTPSNNASPIPAQSFEAIANGSKAPSADTDPISKINSLDRKVREKTADGFTIGVDTSFEEREQLLRQALMN